MRLLRLGLPVIAILVMLLANKNPTMLNISYALFGAAGFVFLLSFIGDFRKRKRSRARSDH